MSLETPNLTLKLADPVHILRLIQGQSSFQDIVGIPAANGFRAIYTSEEVSPAWIKSLRSAKGPDAWRWGFFVIHREVGEVIGAAGFKGPPDAEGMVELAYGIAPDFEGNGYATEAALALVRFAFESPDVKVVRAHTLHSNVGSHRVLEKCDFEKVGEVVDPEDGAVLRWEYRKENNGTDGR